VASRCAESVILDELIESPVCGAPIVQIRSIEVTDAALTHAFKKLRGMVMLYHHARMQAVHRLGDAHSTLLARSLTERLWHFAGTIDSARQATRSALPAGETST